ncbi:MAG: response regulator, partial [Flavobacteriia bacterium]|nr:response regulator [Flavobacteriia bacterium]
MSERIQRVWMIDDNSIDMYLQEELMRRKNIGTSFSHFTSAEKVIELMNTLAKQEEHELPDLILLDIHMPKLDGFGFLEAYSKTVDSFSKHPLLMV